MRYLNLYTYFLIINDMYVTHVHTCIHVLYYNFQMKTFVCLQKAPFGQHVPFFLLNVFLKISYKDYCNCLIKAVVRTISNVVNTCLTDWIIWHFATLLHGIIITTCPYMVIITLMTYKLN